MSGATSKAPRVVTGRTNMESAAIIAKALTSDGDSKPSIEWPAPIINDTTGALSDICCLVERLKVTLDSAIDELGDHVITNTVGIVQSASSDAFCMMRVVSDELAKVMCVIDGVESAILVDRRDRA
jgi:hypothetical protein